MEQNIKYEVAISRIQEILRSIEAGQADVDQLYQEVEEAVALLEFCKGRILATQQNMDTLLQQINPDNKQ